jgi:integrase
MARVNFTAPRVESYQCEAGKGQSILWDSTAPGLGLRATAGGKKQYIFQAKIKGLGTDPRIPIGDPAAWRLPEAREKARQFKLMTDDGQDPRVVIAAKRAAEIATTTEQARKSSRESVTLADVWPAYLADRKPKWSDGHYQNHVNLASAGGIEKKRGKGETVSGPLFPLMPVLLSALTSEKLSEWLATESVKRATNAAQSFRILRALARWTDDIPAYSGLIPTGAFTTRKVRDAVPKGETKEGDSLQREQLAPWFTAVRAISNPVLSAYLQGLLITGARRNELAALRWTDVDFQWNKMNISDKVEGARTIPLTPYLSSLLSTLPRQNEWVFSSSGAESGHIESPTKTHQKALTAAKLPHISIHGLRRTFGTLAEWVDAPTGLVAQIMGHKPSAIAEKHYRRRSIDFLREWHAKIEAWVLTEAKIEWKPSN